MKDKDNLILRFISKADIFEVLGFRMQIVLILCFRVHFFSAHVTQGHENICFSSEASAEADNCYQVIFCVPDTRKVFLELSVLKTGIT